MKFENKMTPKKYKAEREKRGTQTEVAQLLGVQREAVARRENGTRPVTREAWLAICSLPVAT
jgi:DNA-binding XRE family transcriptional regulator